MKFISFFWRFLVISALLYQAFRPTTPQDSHNKICSVFIRTSVVHTFFYTSTSKLFSPFFSTSLQHRSHRTALSGWQTTNTKHASSLFFLRSIRAQFPISLLLLFTFIQLGPRISPAVQIFHFFMLHFCCCIEHQVPSKNYGCLLSVTLDVSILTGW